MLRLGHVAPLYALHHLSDRGLQPVTLDEALSILASWHGMSGRHESQAVREQWARTLFPHDSLEWALRYLESKGAKIPTSTCACVYVRFVSLVGCTCNEHSQPYQPRMGQAVADVERIARRHGAWHTGGGMGQYPSPGDALCMRVENPHVSVVVGSRASDGAILSIDGGQRDNTWTLQRERILVAPDGETPHLVDLDDGVASNVGRVSKLYARVDIATILASLEKCS